MAPLFKICLCKQDLFRENDLEGEHL
uniref:Macaca fascicularis brain cDNA clone: QmoA-11283, similar to human hypothetical protein MGC35048 (MGC35048), mRNA, RefSeq: NM_153208.1 n=1 Tax=Macaca fascicularis TaxID=9541 RepID=I7G8F0_MACFA|nr:unnamed protein product [Macaca fascicularis]